MKSERDLKIHVPSVPNVLRYRSTLGTCTFQPISLPFGRSIRKDLLVFDMFLNRNMGYTAISGYLNRNGYTRPPAKNAIRPSYGEWSSDHIKRMLSNPVYTGRVAWGKRRTEKVPGKDNEYRLVKQDEYILSEVISHEAFVSKEDFDRVQEIKAIRGKKGNHNIGQYNAHLLSGIVKCPQCGAPMYIGMTKWTNQDGTERRTES